jgi:peptidoglycan/xylan/chitin deacetylase (PgdA/CDA1 family)
MDWNMVAALDRSGVASIGAHGVTHAALARLEEAAARHEAAESRRILEARLGRPVVHFAYPFGDPPSAGPREFALCGALGFASATTTRFGNLAAGAGDAPWALPRVPVNGFDDARTVAVKVSGMAAALRAFVR